MSRNDGDAVEVRVAIRPTGSPALGSDPVESIAREIGTFGIAGRAIDGAALGIPGWIHEREGVGPTWQTIEQAGADSPDTHKWVAEVVENLGFGEPDISEFVAQFDLDNEATVHFRAQLRRLEPDFNELAKLLRLPSEVGQILVGAPAMIDRPGFEVFEPHSPRNLIRDEFNRVPTGPGFFDRIQRAAVQGSRWHIGANLFFLAICVLTVGDTFRGRTPLWVGVLAGLFGILTVVDHVLRVRFRRRRRQVSD
ncbi:MAG: hypothetical protein H7288_07835 [Kineosporiaceae bacterium]|nr:hypothetical protein [Aeromicrobium sp.]